MWKENSKRAERLFKKVYKGKVKAMRKKKTKRSTEKGYATAVSE